MKPPILLKTILDICFFILLISLIASMGIILSHLFLTSEGMPIYLNDHIIGEITMPKIILLILAIFQAGIFLFSVYTLRKVVHNFFKKRLFTSIQITGLNLAGRLIVLASILDAIVSFSSNLILESNLKLRFGIESTFGSFWLQLAMGLFLILLSKSFEKAKSFKEENKLTV
ncbi:DUF2975 domain-containing protein [Christiangramia sp. OXR-203]|uniref:DUF2975 domain-containing protein n=1 Tax=Christiangramia sp. OXR-203 TaxID=3100176 RepID=UPI002AC9129A|nr:DUF2975 domain-containing protein [Christiangramia sp. OXR-203]WPY98480.1 DUF2975 domain-containing protein [Christiangramia sp. OXR-203]